MSSINGSLPAMKNDDEFQFDPTSKNPVSGESASHSMIACLILNPSDSELVVGILRKLAAQAAKPGAMDADVSHVGASSSAPQDSWLDHNAAAGYLGISKSTLYRYAEQERVETCKMGGRLEYRRSSLDKFKDQHVRPARRLHRGRGIIPSALSSGK